MKYTVLLLAFGALLSAQTFPAKLVKPLWPDRQGTVEINDEGITYTAPHEKHGPQWLGIQHVGRALDRLDNRPTASLGNGSTSNISTASARRSSWS